MNFSGKFIIYPIRIQTPSFHSITTSVIMIVTMRGNVPHSTNQAVNQVDWRLLGQHVMSTFVSGRVSLVVNDFQFADSFVNFVLHFYLHQHYSNITNVRNLFKL